MRSNAIKTKYFFNEILRYTWSVIGAEISLNPFLVITSENLIYKKITAPIIVNIYSNLAWSVSLWGSVMDQVTLYLVCYCCRNFVKLIFSDNLGKFNISKNPCSHNS